MGGGNREGRARQLKAARPKNINKNKLYIVLTNTGVPGRLSCFMEKKLSIVHYTLYFYFEHCVHIFLKCTDPRNLAAFWI